MTSAALTSPAGLFRWPGWFLCIAAWVLRALSPFPTFGWLHRDGDGRYRQGLFQVMSKHMAFHVRAVYHPVTTHEAPVFLLKGPARHLVEAEFQNEPGIIPILASESPYSRLMDMQCPSYPRRRPLVLQCPQDEPPFLCGQPGMLLLRPTGRCSASESLMQGWLRHGKLSRSTMGR